MQNPKEDSIRKLVTSIEERVKYGDTKLSECRSRLTNMDITVTVYHSCCYTNVTNKTEIERCRLRHENNIPRNITSKSDDEFSTTNDETSAQAVKSLRSTSALYGNNRCIICQQYGGKLRTVAVQETGKKMLNIARSLEDNQFFLRLNSIPNAQDAIANDTKYHLTCWVKVQRKVEYSSGPVQELDDLSTVLADIEIISIVNELVNVSKDVIDMNRINITYNNLLGNVKPENFKLYLKTLLEENVRSIVFSRPPARNQPEKVCSSDVRRLTIESFNNTSDDFNMIFQTAKLIRGKILRQDKWIFEGNFTGFVIPQELQSLLHWIITGPQDALDINSSRKKNVETSVDIVSQIIMNCMKSKRQINHDTNENYRQLIETPFTVDMSLHVHKVTRSRALIDMLSNFHLSISYEKVLKIETLLANAVITKMGDNNGVYVPPNIEHGTRIHFAIDNVDFRNDTPDGKNDCIMVIFTVLTLKIFGIRVELLWNFLITVQC